MTGALHYAGVWMGSEGAELARGLRGRDPELLDRLIQQYQHRLFRYLLYFTRDRQFAEDIFQETWLRVLERGGQYDPRWKFEAWLLSVARNLAIDQMRRKRPTSFAELERADQEEPPAFEVADDGPSPLEYALQQEQGERIAVAMAGVPAYYREVLTLRFHEGLALEEIAQVVSAPLSTVKSRLRRGLGLLAERLEKIRL